MPSSTTVNSQSKNNYLTRGVWSVHSSRGPADFNLQTKSINWKSLNDELRSKIFYLKSELESERAKVKQTHRDKVAEVKKLRDDLENENKRNLDTATIKMFSSKEIEIKKIRDSLTRDKDLEIKQIIKYKDEEIRALQRSMHEEKERSLRDAEEKFNQQLSSRSNNSFTEDQIRKLKLEISEFKKTKETLEESCKQHIVVVNEKNEIIKTLKFEHERELQKVLREARRENSRSIFEMQQLRKSLSEKTTEVSKLSSFADRVLEEKEDLVAQKIKQERLDVSNDRSSLINNSDQQSSSPRTDKGQHLRVKNAELQRQLDTLRKQVKQAEKENFSINASSNASELNSSATDKKIKELKRRNAELVQIAKKLEEKAKQSQKDLQDMKNTFDKSRHDTESINSLKKSFAIQRAKDLAEHARIVLLKDKELDEMRQNKSLSQEEQKMFKEIENALQLAAKERLRLERQLSTSPSISQDEMHQLKNELDGVNKKYVEKVEELLSINNKFQEIAFSFQSLQDKHSLCKQKDEENEMKLKEKLNEIEDLIQEVKEKEEESVALSKSLLNKDQEMTRLQKEVKEKDREFHEQTKTNEMLQSNINIMEENLLELKKQLHVSEKLRNEYNRLEDELFEKTDQCEGLLIKVSKLENDVQQLQNSEDTQKENIKSLEKTNNNLTEKMHSKDAEIRKLQSEMEELAILHKNVVSSLEEDLKKHEEKMNVEKKKGISVGLQTVLMEPVLKDTDNVFEDTIPDLPRKKFSSSSAISDIDVSLQSDILDVVGDRINQLAVSQSEVSITESISEMKLDPLNSEKSEYLENPGDTDNSVPFTDDGDGDEYDGDGDDTDVIDECEDHVEREEVDSDDQFDNINKIENEETEEELNDDTPHEISFLFAQYEASSQSKGPIKLFKSNYMYDPSLYSPNEDSHLELPLEVGTLLYVYGEIDEDGFYLAELQSGKRGLVPSNLIQQIEDINHTTNHADGLFMDEEFSEDKPDKYNDLTRVQLDPPIAAEYLSNTSAMKINTKEESFLLDSEVDDENSQLEEVLVCSPRNIMIERQLQSSVVLSWKPPQQINDVKGYAIYMNGVLKQNVLGSARTKALVSDIQSDKIYRLSIRTVKSDGAESKDEQAVLTLGKGKAFAPYDLCISNITSVSAKVSWKPSHSSHYHIVYLNDVEVNKLQPGCYWSFLTNLSPNLNYEVVVQSCTMLHKNSPVGWRESISFLTLQGFKPEAPLKLDCVVTDDFMEMSWIPVTIQENGTSNGSLVKGYKIYFNGKERFSVTSPTADSLALPVPTHDESLEIYARTQSSAGESENSNSVILKNLRYPLVIANEDVIIPHFGDVVFATVQNESEKQNVSCRSVDEKEYPNEETNEKSLTSLQNNESTRMNPNPENRIIISDDDLSIIEEETELESPSVDQTTQAQYTGTGEATSGTMLDISSDNKIFCSEKSDELKKSQQNDNLPEVKTEYLSTDVHAMLKESRNLLNEYISEPKPAYDNILDCTLSSLNDGRDSTDENDGRNSTDEKENMISLNGVRSKQNFDEDYSRDLNNSTYTDSIENNLISCDSEKNEKPQIERDLNVELNEGAKGSSYSLSDNPNKTYSINKNPSSVDENHNNTYSFNSYKDMPPTQVTKQEILSSMQLDSVDLVEMVEKDAQRDILGEFPELPLDTINAEKLGYSDIGAKQITEQIKDERDPNPKNSSNIQRPIDAVKEILSISDLTPTEDSDGAGDDSIEIDSSLPLSSLQLSSLKSSQDTEPTNQMSSEISLIDDDDVEVNNLLDTSISILHQNEVGNDFLDNRDQTSSTISDVNLQTDALQAEQNTSILNINDIVDTNAQSDSVQKVTDTFLKNANPTPELVLSPTPEPVASPTPEPVASPTSEPVASPTSEPVASPTPEPVLVTSLKDEEMIQVPDNVDLNTIPTTDQNLPADDTHHKQNDELTDEMLERDNDSSENFKISKPLKDIYNFAAIEVSSTELTVTENDVSEFVDDEEDNEFDVTPINALDDSNESGISILKEIDKSRQFPSVNVQSMIGQIEGDSKNVSTTRKTNIDENMTESHGEDVDEQIKVRIFISLYPYNPFTMSPNLEYVDDELAFEQGALIKVYGDVDEDGFYFGELDGVTGLVPSNMVHEVKVDQPINDEGHLSNHGDESDNKNDSFDVSYLLERKQNEAGLDGNSSASENVPTSSVAAGKNRSKDFSTISSSSQDVSTKNVQSMVKRTQDKAASMPDIYPGRKESVPTDVYKSNPVRMVALFDYDPDVSSPNVDAEIELAFRAGEVIHIYGDLDDDGFYLGMAANGRKGLVPSNFVRIPDAKDRIKGTAESLDDVPKIKKKNSFFKKGKKILSKLKGGK